ncbi:hypothetical protein [Roseofilum sp. Guam]|uniref:hypothetical protein n=1 Tax=Roseofilum sp. Guam TaxID=2821502 RepID=UPI001B0841B2|nr:hypothetical protein [Roseofilum sp. Guam]MBP0030445.1 CCA tRNA nucleotidyltransferase [Roseofilum sp. Guam]
MLDLTGAALSPETWPFDLEWLPEETCLVGGAVRDSLLKRQRDYLDLDFVLPEKAVETARQIAKFYDAGFVVLDARRQIARVVFENATADFAQQEGEILHLDLKRRDFTVNAIAYNPFTQTLIDPLEGCQDLQRQLIRMVSAKNLADDPLRLLRAYRQASQLGFTLDRETQNTLIRLAPKLRQVAAERVRMELGYLLNLPSGSEALEKAWKDGVLTGWFPHSCAERVTQVHQVDWIAEELSDRWPQLREHFNQPILASQPTNRISLAKLILFISPEVQNAEAELKSLKLSRAEIRAAIAVLQRLSDILYPQQMDLRDQYFFFQAIRSVFPTLMLLARVRGVALEAIAPLCDRYLNSNDPVVYPQPLIAGNTLIESLNLSKGKLIGQLLTEIQIAQIEGKVSTQAEAIQFAQHWLKLVKP